MEAVTQDTEQQQKQPADLIDQSNLIALEEVKHDTDIDLDLCNLFQEVEDDGITRVTFIYETCSFCKQIFMTNEKHNEYSEKILINERICSKSKDFHYAHQNCFTQAVNEKIAKSTEIFCSDCNIPLTDEKALQLEAERQTVIKASIYLSKAQDFSLKMREIIRNMDKQILQNEFNLILCKKCENIIDISDQLKEKETLSQFVQISDQSIQIDTQISQKPQFMAQCGDQKCAHSFCLECKVEPYHQNYSCSEYQIYLDTRQCRFCLNLIGKNQQTTSDQKAFKDICNDQACVQLMSSYCDRMNEKCAHFCYGTANETNCIPCIHSSCVQEHQELTFGICSKDDCLICYTDPLGSAPVVKMRCNHMFHEECLYKILQNKWSGNRVNFGFMNCPICSQLMESENSVKIQSIILELQNTKQHVEQLAQNRAEREGVFTAEEYLIKYTDPTYEQQVEYAMHKLAIYKCHDCQAYYCGGRRDCEAELDEAKQPKPEDILCIVCTSYRYEILDDNCVHHGDEYIEYKCQFCCETAVWYCWGGTRMCEPCHNIAGENIPKICNENTCPYKGQHPENGKHHSFGCNLCKILETEKVEIPQETMIVEKLVEVQNNQENLELQIEVQQEVQARDQQLNSIDDQVQENLQVQEDVDQKL